VQNLNAKSKIAQSVEAIAAQVFPAKQAFAFAA